MTLSLNIASFAQRERTTSNKPLIAARLHYVSLLLIMGHLSLGMSEAVAAPCTANTSPVNNCDDLSITGNNLTITVPNLVTVGGNNNGEAIRVTSTSVTEAVN
jgi:hypothetical protein